MGQSQDFDKSRRRVPVSTIKVEPLAVINARQVAFGHKKHPNKPLQGMLKNLSEKITPRYIREIKEIGDQKKIMVTDVFAAGDKVKVTGISKGKGFQGVVHRHHFKGGPKTHGQSDRQRHPGSIGQTTTPGRVYKGKRMAGHMGAERVTVKNLTVFAVKPEENLLLIQGLVPGAKNTLLTITK